MILASGPKIPNFGKPDPCVVEDHAFCWSWVRAHWGDTLQPALLRDLMPEHRPAVAVLEEPLDHEVLGGRARVIRDTDGELEVALESEGDMLLVVAQTYYPGWEVAVRDGPKARLVRAFSMDWCKVSAPRGHS